MNYKIKEGVLSVSAANNKVFHASEKGVYTEDDWETGEAEELVKEGFLERVEEVTEVKSKKK